LQKHLRCNLQYTVKDQGKPDSWCFKDGKDIERMIRKEKTIIIFILILGVLVTTTILSFNNDSGENKTSHGKSGLLSQKEIEKLPKDGGPNYNRLIFEKSPYLLQHAANPVDWYPWGDEAFERAKKEDKPIFLSIGYSTCHWCHVMEHESFEDPEVARLMNETFIAIKVDREERPDIDNIYMSVCQMMTGGGGWPLTILMTPEKKPFFAGTYFPKESRYGRIGMIDLIKRVQQLWQTNRAELEKSAAQVETTLQQQLSKKQLSENLDESILAKTFRQFAERFDKKRGGFGKAPKFPSPHNLLFLLRYWKRTGNEKSLQMVEKTLQEMRLGGIYDHIGYGFHRYATDANWLLPHFEKMLYDQAMISLAYLEAYQATKNDDFAQTAREIFSYILRDMTSQDGGFYSAEDADSEDKEGKFYLWHMDEVRKILPHKDAELFIKVYNLKEGGNFAEQATGQKTGENIPYLTKPIQQIALELNIPQEELKSRLEKIREKLFAFREKRIHPHKDDKILTDWNGLMIAALARGAQVLGDERYLKAAKRDADFILQKLRTNRGRLLHRYRDGQAALPGFVDDYAFLIWGLIEIYEADFDIRYLDSAIDLTNKLLSHFWDDENGGFYFTPDDGEELLVRQKEIYDGAIPSGNSVAALNLLRLARMTANIDYERKANAIFQSFAQKIEQMPSAHAQLLSAFDFQIGPSYEVVVVGRTQSQETKRFLTKLNEVYQPNKVVLLVPEEQQNPRIHELAEFTKYQISLGGKTTAYVCRNFACDAPTTDYKKMLLLLEKS